MDDDTDRYWMRPTGSGKSSTPKGRSLTSTSPAQADPHRSDWIRTCAQQILSSYRKDDFADPDGYFVQLAIVLERYDDDVIRAVTSPVTGIQRTCKFPPSIAEFVEFIDEHIRRSTYAASYDTRSQEQLRLREQIEREQKAEPPEKRKEVADRIRAELRASGFQFKGDAKPAANHWKRYSADELLAKYPIKADRA